MRWIARLILVCLLAYAAKYVLLHVRITTARQYRFSMQSSMYLAGLAMYGLVVVGWMLIWAGMVKWMPVRRLATVMTIVLSLPVGYVLGDAITRDIDFGWFLSAVLPTGLFVLGTIAVWIPFPKWRWEKKNPDPIQVPCPACGYDLRGLREARCPECGGEFTLEQLVRRATAT